MTANENSTYYGEEDYEWPLCPWCNRVADCYCSVCGEDVCWNCLNEWCLCDICERAQAELDSEDE